MVVSLYFFEKRFSAATVCRFGATRRFIKGRSLGTVKQTGAERCSFKKKVFSFEPTDRVGAMPLGISRIKMLTIF